MWVTELLRAVSKPLQWWELVAPWEQAVRARGKWVKHLLPGIHFRVPYLDRVTRTSTRERIVETDLRTCITKDGKSVTFSLGLHYSIRHLDLMVGRVVRPEGTLRLLAVAEALDRIGKTNLHSIALRDLARSIEAALEVKAAEWGLSVVRCYITTFVEARPLRLLVAKDGGYASAFDHALDEKPAEAS